MPTVQGSSTTNFTVVELASPLPVPTQYGTVYVPHVEHQKAKKEGKQTVITSVVVNISIKWTNYHIPKVGHYFSVWWVDENGNYQKVGDFDPVGKPGDTDTQSQSITAMFPSLGGCFGLNAFKIEGNVHLFATPIGGFDDTYEMQVTETVTYIVA